MPVFKVNPDKRHQKQYQQPEKKSLTPLISSSVPWNICGKLDRAQKALRQGI